MRNSKLRTLTILALALVVTSCSNSGNNSPVGSIPDFELPALDHSYEYVPSAGSHDALMLKLSAEFPEFAGLYVNPTDDTKEISFMASSERLQTLGTDDFSNVEDKIIDLFGEGFLETTSTNALTTQSTPSLRVANNGVQYSFNQLVDFYGPILGSVRNGNGVVFTDINETQNKVIIAVQQEYVDAYTQHLRGLNIPTDAYEIIVEEPIVINTALDNYRRPILGGLGVSMSSGGLCTLGFNAIVDGVRGFITNNHCTGNMSSVTGERFSQGRRSVGTEVADVPVRSGSGCASNAGIPCTEADAAFVRYNQGVEFRLGQIVQTPVGSQNVQATPFTITGTRDAIEGEIVDRVGRTTGRRQGRVRSADVIVRTAGSDGQTTHAVANSFLTAAIASDNVYSSPGDSGSPTFVVNDNNEVELVGIHWGGSPGSGVFSSFSSVASNLPGNVQVIATDAAGSLSAEGEWASSGGRDANSPNNPRYTFEVTQSGSVTIDLTSSIDTYLYLLDANGSVITTNDDGGEGYNSRITRNLSAGTYTIVAATYDSGKSGTFNVSVQGDVRNLSNEGSVIVKNGNWTSSGGKNPTNSGNPTYTFTVTQAGSVEINLTSSVDTYLYLRNSNNTSTIATDDDGGDGYNSRIIRDLSAGTYTVVAATYSSGQSGAFNLEIEGNVR